MTVRPWPLLILAAPAAVAVWSGWVGIGQMTGFGKIQPLPGIWNSLHLDTAVTLPIGVEAYAAFALHAWLTSNPAVSDRTRRFARWSAIAALILGMAGQAAYHLLVQAGVTKAPWEVTTLVSCLPVLVLGMGSALAHLIRSDASAAGPDIRVRPASITHVAPTATEADANPAGDERYDDAATGQPMLHSVHRIRARPPARKRPSDAYAAAARVIASGQQVSRRSLRSAGLHGSNADLGMLAHLVKASPRTSSPRAAAP